MASPEVLTTKLTNLLYKLSCGASSGTSREILLIKGVATLLPLLVLQLCQSTTNHNIGLNCSLHIDYRAALLLLLVLKFYPLGGSNFKTQSISHVSLSVSD